MYQWELSQQNLVTFVMVDLNSDEVLGLGATFTLQISKAGGPFAPGAGTKAEIGNGWYKYLATAAEADTIGPVIIIANHPTSKQQNLEYVVENRAINSIEFTYTLTSTTTTLPIPDAQVFISTDIAGLNVVWAGVTDTFGVARDANNKLPRLDPGTYFFVSQKSGYTIPLDTEVVS